MQKSEPAGPVQSIVRRIQTAEIAPVWSLPVALFFVLAYIVLWIAGQIIAATLSADFTSALAPGALLGSLAVLIVVVQWARRTMPETWVSDLRLTHIARPPVYMIVLVGLASAWAIDLVGVLLNLKGAEVVPPVLQPLGGPLGLTWVIAAIFAFLVQPLADGLIFCGLVYPALARDLRSNLLACLTIALFYSLINAAIFATGAGSWYLLIQPFLLMLVVVLIRAYSQSTQLAIVARALFGLFFILAALISRAF